MPHEEESTKKYDMFQLRGRKDLQVLCWFVLIYTEIVRALHGTNRAAIDCRFSGYDFHPVHLPAKF